MESGAEDRGWKSEGKEARLTCERRKRSRQKEAGGRGIYNAEWPQRLRINANGTDSGVLVSALVFALPVSRSSTSPLSFFFLPLSLARRIPP